MLVVCKPVIDAIKAGCRCFAYHPDEYDARTSPILNAAFDLSAVNHIQNTAQS